MLSRRAFIGPAILLVALVVGYPAWWFFAAHLAETLVTDWVDDRRRDGLDIRHGEIERTGFPLLVRLAIPAPAANDRRNGWSWQGPTLSLEFRPWNLQRFRIEAGGPQQFRYAPDSRKGDFTARATDVVGVAVLGNSGRLNALSIVVDQPRLAEAEAGRVLAARQILADLSRPSVAPIAHTEKSLGLSLIVEKAELSGIEARPLGRTIDWAQIDAEFRGPLEGTDLRAALSDWRDAGGTFEIHWLNLVWGGVDLRANGTAALDDHMRPLGALTADIRGYEEILEAMAEAGLLRRDVLPASRVTLNLLARKDEADGRRVLTVPLTAQKGALFLGPIKLTDIPPLLTNRVSRSSAPPG